MAGFRSFSKRLRSKASKQLRLQTARNTIFNSVFSTPGHAQSRNFEAMEDLSMVSDQQIPYDVPSHMKGEHDTHSMNSLKPPSVLNLSEAGPSNSTTLFMPAGDQSFLLGSSNVPSLIPDGLDHHLSANNNFGNIDIQPEHTISELDLAHIGSGHHLSPHSSYESIRCMSEGSIYSQSDAAPDHHDQIETLRELLDDLDLPITLEQPMSSSRPRIRWADQMHAPRHQGKTFQEAWFVDRALNRSLSLRELNAAYNKQLRWEAELKGDGEIWWEGKPDNWSKSDQRKEDNENARLTREHRKSREEAERIQEKFLAQYRRNNGKGKDREEEQQEE